MSDKLQNSCRLSFSFFIKNVLTREFAVQVWRAFSLSPVSQLTLWILEREESNVMKPSQSASVASISGLIVTDTPTP
jgi:hypothetical protein